MEKDLEQCSEEFIRALETRNIDKICDFYDPAAFLLVEHHDMFQGRDKIRQYFEQHLPANCKYEFQQRDMTRLGENCLEETGVLAAHNDRTNWHESHRFLTVWKREGSRFRMIRDVILD